MSVLLGFAFPHVMHSPLTPTLPTRHGRIKGTLLAGHREAKARKQVLWTLAWKRRSVKDTRRIRGPEGFRPAKTSG